MPSNLDAKAQEPTSILTWAYRVVRWYLILSGSVLWTVLWFQRHPSLGVLQLALIGYVLYRDTDGIA